MRNSVKDGLATHKETCKHDLVSNVSMCGHDLNHKMHNNNQFKQGFATSPECELYTNFAEDHPEIMMEDETIALLQLLES